MTLGNESIAIARANPEFEHGITARVEVWPIKVKEESTGHDYPRKWLMLGKYLAPQIAPQLSKTARKIYFC